MGPVRPIRGNLLSTTLQVRSGWRAVLWFDRLTTLSPIEGPGRRTACPGT